MKKIKILVILMIIFLFGSVSSEAQLSQKMSYQELTGITSDLKATQDTTFDLGNFPYLTNPAGSFSSRMRMRNSFDYIYKPIPFSYTVNKLSWKSAMTDGNENNGSFNARWESLTGKPIIDTSTFYIYPVRRTNVPSWSDNRLYRFSANIFNMAMTVAYPHAYTPEKSPASGYQHK